MKGPEALRGEKMMQYGRNGTVQSADYTEEIAHNNNVSVKGYFPIPRTVLSDYGVSGW